jgi:hypothetical protein
MYHKMITEAGIEALATAQSYERGYDYYTLIKQNKFIKIQNFCYNTI